MMIRVDGLGMKAAPKRGLAPLMALMMSLLFVGVHGGASAQSLKSVRAQQAEESALDSEVSYTNSVCGTDISASIDWSSAGGWPEDESLAEACDGALGAVEAVCRASGGKARAARISTFVCKGDGSGPSLSGGTLRYGASPGANGFSQTKSLLDGSL